MGTGLVSDLQAAGLPRNVALRAAIAASPRVRQIDVAKHVDISQGQLSKLLAGRVPLTDELADRIADAITALAAETAA